MLGFLPSRFSCRGNSNHPGSLCAKLATMDIMAELDILGLIAEVESLYAQVNLPE